MLSNLAATLGGLLGQTGGAQEDIGHVPIDKAYYASGNPGWFMEQTSHGGPGIGTRVRRMAASGTLRGFTLDWWALAAFNGMYMPDGDGLPTRLSPTALGQSVSEWAAQQRTIGATDWLIGFGENEKEILADVDGLWLPTKVSQNRAGSWGLELVTVRSSEHEKPTVLVHEADRNEMREAGTKVALSGPQPDGNGRFKWTLSVRSGKLGYMGGTAAVSKALDAPCRDDASGIDVQAAVGLFVYDLAAQIKGVRAADIWLSATSSDRVTNARARVTVTKTNGEPVLVINAPDLGQNWTVVRDAIHQLKDIDIDGRVKGRDDVIVQGRDAIVLLLRAALPDGTDAEAGFEQLFGAVVAGVEGPVAVPQPGAGPSEAVVFHDVQPWGFAVGTGWTQNLGTWIRAVLEATPVPDRRAPVSEETFALQARAVELAVQNPSERAPGRVRLTPAQAREARDKAQISVWYSDETTKDQIVGCVNRGVGNKPAEARCVAMPFWIVRMAHVRQVSRFDGFAFRQPSEAPRSPVLLLGVHPPYVGDMPRPTNNLKVALYGTENETYKQAFAAALAMWVHVLQLANTSGVRCLVTGPLFFAFGDDPATRRRRCRVSADAFATAVSLTGLQPVIVVCAPEADDYDQFRLSLEGAKVGNTPIFVTRFNRAPDVALFVASRFPAEDDANKPVVALSFVCQMLGGTSSPASVAHSLSTSLSPPDESVLLMLTSLHAAHDVIGLWKQPPVDRIVPTQGPDWRLIDVAVARAEQALPAQAFKNGVGAP